MDWVKNIQAIGWDLDGTLYPPDSIPHGVIRDRQIEAIMLENGWSKEQARGEFGEKILELGSSTKSMTALGVDGAQFFREIWDSLPLEKYVKRDPKIVKLFKNLRQYRHFMVSNSNMVSQIENKLRLIGLSKDKFEVIISTTDELGVVKPDPRPFVVALEKMGLKADQTLYVGDRVETDIVGAKNVGMRTCLVGRESELADVCLSTVYAIEDLLAVKIE